MSTKNQESIERMGREVLKLQRQIAELNKQNETEEKILKMPFSEMNYSNLMKFYFSNEDMFFERNSGCNPIVVSWYSAYSVFKSKRDLREEKIRHTCKQFIEHCDGIIIRETMDKILFPIVKSIYETETPFDCTDEKWKTQSSWEKRVQLAITLCTNQMGIFTSSIRILNYRL